MTDRHCPTCGHVREPEPLTTRERSLLGIIVAKIDADGIAPNTKEMAFAMNIRGASLITALLGRLHRKGWIEHRKGKHRGTRLLHRPRGRHHTDGRNITAARAHDGAAQDTPSEILAEGRGRRPGRSDGPARGKRRDCLQCGRPFASKGRGDRICDSCEDTPEWSSGNDLVMGA